MDLIPYPQQGEVIVLECPTSALGGGSSSKGLVFLDGETIAGFTSLLLAGEDVGSLVYNSLHLDPLLRVETGGWPGLAPCLLVTL